MLTPYIWYQFETITSTQVKNYGSGGTALDATLHNGASVMKSDSPIGSVCLNLMNTPTKQSSDASGQYLSFPSFKVSGVAFSCSCWFKKSNTNETWSRIFDFSVTPNGGKTISLAFSGNTGQIVLDRNDTFYKGISNVNSTNYCDNKWHHIVIVGNGSSLSFYIDNVKLNTMQYKILEPAERVTNSIGRSSYTSDAYASIQIDDFRWYTLPLNDVDVTALFNYKKTETITQKVQYFVSDKSWYMIISGSFAIIIIIVVFVRYFIFRKKENYYSY